MHSPNAYQRWTSFETVEDAQRNSSFIVNRSQLTVNFFTFICYNANTWRTVSLMERSIIVLHTRGHSMSPITGMKRSITIVSHGIAASKKANETKRNKTAGWNNYLRHPAAVESLVCFPYFSPTRDHEEGERLLSAESGPWIHSVGFCATRRFSNPLLLFLQPLFLRQASQPVIDST